MTILERLRNRRPRVARAVGGPATSPADGQQVPIPDYDHLDVKSLYARLSELSQIELAAVETYERSHEDRPHVLDKLRYMRATEPLPDYDALSPEQIAEALAGADSETVRAVRDYERKFQHRQAVSDEVARVLPRAQASAGEDRARDEKAARVRQGFAGRAKTADGLASDRSDGRGDGSRIGPDS